MTAGTDVSLVIEFIEQLRRQRPGISPSEVAALVEEKFPHILIEMEGKVPRIEIR
jgi:hypothetical protein